MQLLLGYIGFLNMVVLAPVLPILVRVPMHSYALSHFSPHCGFLLILVSSLNFSIYRLIL